MSIQPQPYPGFSRFRLPGWMLMLGWLVIETAFGQAGDQEPAIPSVEAPERSDTTLFVTPEDLRADTSAFQAADSGKVVLDAEVRYAADDSLTISVRQQRIFLYRNGSVDYEDINLKADYIEFDLNSKTVRANGMPDSSGNVTGKPVFVQGQETFESDTLRYNFDSRKGIIKRIITEQGEGYLHSEKTKRLEDGQIHISDGKYTTCDDPNPHFYIKLTKAIAIPDEKIVSGPAYLVLEDIPLPLALPFGFFPFTSTRASGLIIPTYGEEKTRGFFLRNGGWYVALNDYVDFTILGNVYSRGTWGLTASSVYTVRYRFSGNLSAEFYNNRVNDDPDFEGSRDFKISWTHTQDAKANPTRKFSANVNFSTLSYDKNHSYNMTDYITNTKSSSISFSKTWPGRPFNLTANINQTQNSQSRMINMTLPNISFNVSRLYPFRGKNTSGNYNWFQNIQLSYSSKLENRISAPDSSFFTRNTLEKMKNGFYHSIPVSLTNIKLFDVINISPGISYNGMLYTSYITRRMISDTAIFAKSAVNDTVRKITYAHALTASLGISASPKIYTMLTARNPDARVTAIRHVMTPSVSFSFAPDMSSIMPDYYRTITYPATITMPAATEKYSIYENNLYGTPVPQGRSGSLSLALNNNLEMKVRSARDSAGEIRKVAILKNLNFSASYSPFAKNYRWSSLNMSGATSLFTDKLNIQFGATFDPYATDSAGRKTDRYLIREKGRLFRTTAAHLSASFSLRSQGAGSGTASDSQPDQPTEGSTVLTPIEESTGLFGGEYVDFDIPWSLNVDYSWSFSKPGREAFYNHTVRLSGDLSLTPRWKIGMNSGFDFVTGRVTTTNISIYRDLHCWEMRFSVVPFGDRRSYTFTISAKSSILRDVKYNKSRSWYDNF